MRNFKEVVDHLPPAAVLTVDGVTWEEYEKLGLDQRPGLRITYDQGRLELVTTSAGHERCARFFDLLFLVLAEVSEMKIESVGGATQEKKRSERAVEPDCSFYIGNIERILNNEGVLNLEVDPPPDIVVEIDKAGQSLDKFPIYAEFGVPEIWRYDMRRKRAQIFELVNKSYVGIAFSRFFPMLTAEDLTRFVEQSRSEGQSAAISALRQFCRRGRDS